MNLDLNNAQCMAQSNGFGKTIYTNVCTGQITEVPYGAMDWVAFFSITGLVVALVGVFGGILYHSLRDHFAEKRRRALWN